MAYRLIELHAVVADDSNQANKSFDRTATIWQTLDLETASPSLRVAPGDVEASIALGTIAQGYAVVVMADYPIRVRFNGPSATQFTLTSNNVPAQNVGAPLPANCVFAATMLVTSLYVQPITSAAQTANVWLTVTGDPSNPYT